MPEPEVQKVVVDGRRLRLTSLDKILYPATETTKGEVLNYYAQISAYFLPLLPLLLLALVPHPGNLVHRIAGILDGAEDLRVVEVRAPPVVVGVGARRDIGHMLGPLVVVHARAARLG